MISPMDSAVDKVDYCYVCKNINIVPKEALSVIEFSPLTVKITFITIILELLFSNLIPIRKFPIPNLNKRSVESFPYNGLNI